MKEQYEECRIEVICFETGDIVTVSCAEFTPDTYEGEMVGFMKM